MKYKKEREYFRNLLFDILQMVAYKFDTFNTNREVGLKRNSNEN